MATPLTAISKYTGVLMATMCVLLMFSFVVADPLMQYAGGGASASSREKQPVASWDGGTINERQLNQAVINRNILAQFQVTVERMGAQAAIEDGIDLQYAGRRVEPMQLPRSREQAVETSVVRTKIFAEKATEAGMVVSDGMIVDYLQAISFDRVSNADMRSILKRMNSGGGRTTIAQVFDLIREAMLANNYLSSHTYAFRTILPEERWEDWKKVNERVVVEAAALPIESFVDEVPEPSDAELEEFFALYKNREPSSEVLRGFGNVELPSALPAFATPPRVKLAYLKADFNVVAEQLVSEVTDAEVAAYYEENKESFVEADRALFGGADSIFGADDLLANDTDEPEEEPTGEEPVAEEESTEAPAEEAEMTEEAATEEPASEEAAPETEEEAAEESVNPLRDDSPVEEEEEEEEVAETEDAEATDEPAAEDSEATAEPNDEADEAEETVYQPLEEVSDEIRRILANQRAAQRLQDKMNRLKLTLDDAYVEYFDARLEAEASKSEEQPKAPTVLTDLKPLAEEEQLELVELDQSPQMELRETEPGRSINIESSAQQPLPAWYLAFRPDDVDTFQPLLTYDLDGNRYLILVTERYDAKTPELDELRDQVVAAWKRTKAAELAQEKAEELAKEIGPTGKSLEDYFADAGEDAVKPASIDETDAFALLTIGQVAPSARQIPLRLSQPAPLVAAGPALLEGVFDIGEGEVGAELNHDHSIAYLLRIAQRIGSEDELRREFLRDGDRWMGAQVLMQSRVSQKVRALTGNLLEESSLQWERTPDQLR